MVGVIAIAWPGVTIAAMVILAGSVIDVPGGTSRRAPASSRRRGWDAYGPVSWQEETLMDLAGKVALVTGATSGIGRATAIGFAAEGHTRSRPGETSTASRMWWTASAGTAARPSSWRRR